MRYQNAAALTSACETLKSHDSLPVKLIARNFWNFYELNHYDKALFEHFCETILSTEDKFHHQDISNTIQALGHFEHLNFKVMELLIKQTIKDCENFKLQSLAIISNSLADLGVKNDTLFAAIAKVIFDKHD